MCCLDSIWFKDRAWIELVSAMRSSNISVVRLARELEIPDVTWHPRGVIRALCVEIPIVIQDQF